MKEFATNFSSTHAKTLASSPSAHKQNQLSIEDAGALQNMSETAKSFTGTPFTFNIHYPGSESVVESGDIISALPTLSGIADAYAAVDLSYTTEHGVFYSRVNADHLGNWQTTPEFLYVDSAFGTRFEIEASSGDFTSEKFVVNVMPASDDLMADILVDSRFTLFDVVPAVVVEEPLLLTITESDMQFQSAGVANQIFDIQPALPTYQEDINYLVSVS